MKTLTLTLAAVATLMAGAAHAASTSSSTGEVTAFNPNKQVLFGGPANVGGLDLEPTASIGASTQGQVFTADTVINGRDVMIRYKVEGGERVILNKSFHSSER